MDKRVEKTIKNLKKNNMAVYYADTKTEAIELIKSLVKRGETVSVGGSVTLDECGVFEFLRSGDFDFLDRYKAGLTPEQRNEIFKKCFFCDTYFTSANAVTENGELINVDGNCNRIAAISFGPKSVICLVGINKIVPDVEAGFRRVKEIAAPLNAKRLGVDTPCAKNGICCAVELPLGTGCASAERMCANYLVSARQRTKNRIKVIICNENLGY